MVFSKYKSYLFDLDGTLVDSMPSHNQSWIEVFRSEGITIDEAEFIAVATGMAGVDIIRRFAGFDVKDEDIRRFSEKRIPIFKSLISNRLTLLPGCAEFLEKSLREGKKLAIATSSSLNVLDFMVTELNLKQWFSVIVSRKEVARGKPFPDLFIEAARSLETLPQDCLVFEDSDAGIKAAQNAGMDYCVLETAFSREQQKLFVGPGFIDSQPHFKYWL